MNLNKFLTAASVYFDLTNWLLKHQQMFGGKLFMPTPLHWKT